MDKKSLIDFLKATSQAIENNDSAEGSIHYEWGSKEDFNVNAFVRVGNSMGQGGCMLVNERLRSNPPRGPEDLEATASEPVCTYTPKKVVSILTRLTEKVERANSLQHSGGSILAEDWSELYMLTNEARGVLAEVETPEKG